MSHSLAPPAELPSTRSPLWAPYAALATAKRGAVEIDRVSKTFAGADGPVPAVAEVTLSVAAGEFCVIVGPSGCGKTTLLRMIAGLERPSAGAIATRSDLGAPLRNAMVFQGRSVFPWLRVLDNVAYGLKLQGVGRRERHEAASALLDTVGLTRFARAFPHQLSEGMRQRIAIARALAVQPDLLLMDEPFGALDEQTRLIMQEELLRIWEQSRKTVVFITHSIDEAMLLADRVVVVSAAPGRIVADLAMPFPRPRTLASIRGEAEFAPLFAEIWARLREEGLQRRGETR